MYDVIMENAVDVDIIIRVNVIGFIERKLFISVFMGNLLI